MNTRLLIAFILIFATFLTACSKKNKEVIDCNSIVAETGPTNIVLKFTDKTTGENLILSKNIIDADVTVTDKQTGNVQKNWRIAKSNADGSPINGTLGFAIFGETAGVYNYQITIKDVGSAILSYTITKEKGSVCRPFYYPVKDVKITDSEYSLLVVNGKEIENFLIIKL